MCWIGVGCSGAKQQQGNFSWGQCWPEAFALPVCLTLSIYLICLAHFFCPLAIYCSHLTSFFLYLLSLFFYLLPFLWAFGAMPLFWREGQGYGIQHSYEEGADCVCVCVCVCERERRRGKWECTAHLHTSNPISECLSGWESVLWVVSVSEKELLSFPLPKDALLCVCVCW